MESNLSSIQQLVDDMKEFLLKQAGLKEKDLFHPVSLSFLEKS